MKYKYPLLSLLVLTALLFTLRSSFAQGTQFTYQGRLNTNGTAFNGTVGLRFKLFSDLAGNNQVGSTFLTNNVGVANGLFTTGVDFGAGIFTGSNYFLLIGVSTNGGTSFTDLSPLQPVTATPYAIMANSASNLLGKLATAQLNGTVGNGQLANSSITVTAGTGLGGGGAVALGGTTTLSNAGVLSVTGGASDITANTVGGVVTLGSDATSVATPNTLVRRDATGSFAVSNLTVNGVASGNGGGLTNIQVSAVGPQSMFSLLSVPNYFFTTPAYAVGAQPQFLVAVDVNGDGKVDLISGNVGGQSLTVYTNNGKGFFALNSTFVLGIAPTAVVAADVNNDGKVDVLCATPASTFVSVLTNDGTGHFLLSLASSFDTGAAISAIAVADVNGDGKPDVITASIGGNTLQVFTNNGSGVFTFNATLTVDFGPVAILAVDVNGDHKVDLISANSDLGTLTVLTNNGSGGFSLKATISGAPTTSLAAADVNGDGKVDVIAAGGFVAVFTNDGSGGLVLNNSYIVGNNAVSVVATNLYGGGNVDLVAANSGDNTLAILTNNGIGTFGSNATVSVGNQPKVVVAADFNGDGLLDLAVANSGDNTLTVLLGATQQLSIGAAVLLDNSGSSFAGNGSGLKGIIASNLTGTLTPAQLPSAVVTNNEKNVSLGGSFNGNGGGLTNLLSTQVVGGANSNLFIGMNAGNLTMTGFNNLGIGLGVLASNTTGFDNLGIGVGALSNNTTGMENAAFGFAALALNTTGVANTAIGVGAMLSNSIGNDNTAVGLLALADNTTGLKNTALGAGALNFNTNGIFNTAAGFQALAENTSGQLNTGIGTQALLSNTAGSNNTAVGGAALIFNISGVDNTALGRDALRNLGSSTGAGGTNNIGIGFLGGASLTGDESNNIDIGNFGVPGDNNIIRIGSNQVQAFIGGTQLLGIANSNLFLGTNAGNLTMSGSQNVGMGQGVLSNNTAGADNTVLGFKAMLLNTTGGDNTAIGLGAMANNTNGSANTAIGSLAMTDNKSGSQNTAVGDGTLENNTNGNNNIAVGFQALVFNGSGSENTAIGENALGNNQSGNNNIAVGANALNINISGSNNIAIGQSALANLEATGGPGTNNIAIGNLAGANLLSGNSNIYIGSFGGTSFESGTIRIGTPGIHTSTFIAGTISGNGSGLTSLPANAALLNATQTFTSANTFTNSGAVNSLNVFGIRTGGQPSPVALFENKSTAASGNSPALRVQTDNAASDGALSVSVNVASGTANSILAEFGNSTAFVTVITNDGTIYTSGNIVAANGSVTANNISINNSLVVDSGNLDVGLNQGSINGGLVFGSGSGEGMTSVRASGFGDSFGLNFYSNFAKRMTILQNGNVGIGTTNADSLLTVNGTADKPGGGSWNTFSDARLKDIGPEYTHGLEDLAKIQPVHYHYKADNALNLPSQPEHIGVVAQQVRQAIPEAVEQGKSGYLSVNNDPIIWAMVNAIKELKAENESLKQRLDRVEKETAAARANAEPLQSAP